jgi:RNA polymerase sigma-70 factor (ECF subfamily)
MVSMQQTRAGRARDARALGREREFEELVLAYQQRIYAFALRLSGSPRDAEEIAQDAFVRAYAALEGYSTEQARTLKVRPWLYQIALNVFRNRVRRRQLPAVPLEATEDGTPLEIEGDSRDWPHVAAESTEQREELAALLAGLPEHFRIAVVLRHVEGMSYGEMANILGQPVGTIKAHVHRGTLRLREALTHQRDEVIL